MAALIGALRVTLSADTAAFQKGMKGAERQAAMSGSIIQKSLSGIKAGIAGLATGLSIGMLARTAKEALDYAASLGEVAQQLGVTTKDLQVFRYAASQVGVSQEEMDKGLAKLTLTMGKAQVGSKQAAAAFGAIGISIADLKDKDAGAVIRMVADGLQKIENPAQRAAVEIALFGKAGQKLDTLLSGGSKAISELEAAAQSLGIVLSDDQIQRADETADKLAALKMVLEARIAGVVADNASSILALADSLAQLVGWVQKAGRAWLWYKDTVLASKGDLQATIGLTRGVRNEGEAQSIYAQERLAARAMEDRLGMSGSDMIAGVMRGGGSRSVGGADVPDFMAGPGKKGPRGKSAEQLAEEARRKHEEALRRAFEYESEQRRNQINILRAQEDLVTSNEDRVTLAAQIMDIERAQERSSLELDVKLGERTQAEADALNAQLDNLDVLKRSALLADEAYDRQREILQIEEGRLEIERDQLDAQSRLAETAAERREVELRILDLAYRQEKARLEAVLADERASDAEREVARQRLGSLGSRYNSDRQGVLQGTRGPLESFLSELPNTAAKANEALEAVAANGLQSLTDGLTEAMMGTKKLGAVFAQVAKQIIADLIRIQIQRSIVEPLGRALGGILAGIGGGISSGGLTGSAAADRSMVGDIPGFASGGSFTVAGRGGTDRNLLSLNGLPIARVSQGERVAISPDNDNSRGVVVHQNITFSGSVDMASKQEVYRVASMIKPLALDAMRDTNRRRG